MSHEVSLGVTLSASHWRNSPANSLNKHTGIPFIRSLKRIESSYMGPFAVHLLHRACTSKGLSEP